MIAMTKAIVLLSGGIDSAVTLFLSVQKGWHVHPLTFHYHLRPRREVEATERLAELAGRRDQLIEVGLPFLMEAEDLLQEGVDNPRLQEAPPTYVPARNLIFYSIAAHYAEVRAARWIVGGHNGLDSDTFPDATLEFFQGLNRLLVSGLLTASRFPVEIVNPLHGLSKADVIRQAWEHDVPLEHTWSCSHDGGTPCSTCFPCRQRANAFAQVGRQDPLLALPREPFNRARQ